MSAIHDVLRDEPEPRKPQIDDIYTDQFTDDEVESIERIRAEGTGKLRVPTKKLPMRKEP